MNKNRDVFECCHIARHLKDMPYREAKDYCESMREGDGYNRKHDDGDLDNCWLAFCDGMMGEQS